MKEKLVSDSRTVMTEMIMPNDANPLGNLMGGNMIRWMDIAGSICAAKHCESHVVTASVDHVSFTSPIGVGEVITINATITRAFNTSVEVYVEVSAADFTSANRRPSNHAYLSFVALSPKTKKPCKVPPLKVVNSKEQKFYEGASRRRELRLILSGRMKPGEASEIKDFFANT